MYICIVYTYTHICASIFCHRLTPWNLRCQTPKVRSHYSLSLLPDLSWWVERYQPTKNHPRGRWKGETFLGWLVRYKTKKTMGWFFLGQIFWGWSNLPNIGSFVLFGIPKQFQPMRIWWGWHCPIKIPPKIPWGFQAWCNWITSSRLDKIFHQRRFDVFFLSKCTIWRDRYFVYTKEDYITWNIIPWRFGRSFSFLNGWFVGSMLIFQGVPGVLILPTQTMHCYKGNPSKSS